MVVIFVLLPVLVIENDVLLSVVNRRLEDLVRPLVLSTPVVLLGLVLEVVVPDIGVPIRNADVDAPILQHSRNLSQHFF